MGAEHFTTMKSVVQQDLSCKSKAIAGRCQLQEDASSLACHLSQKEELPRCPLKSQSPSDWLHTAYRIWIFIAQFVAGSPKIEKSSGWGNWHICPKHRERHVAASSQLLSCKGIGCRTLMAGLECLYIAFLFAPPSSLSQLG